MEQQIKNKLKLLVLLMLCIPFAMVASGRDAPSGTLSITAKGGFSILLSEVHTDFSEAVKNFGNKAGPAAGFEISYAFTPSMEVGIGYTMLNLKGHTSAIEEFASSIQNGIDSTTIEHAWYQNKLSGPQVFLRYYPGKMRTIPGSLNVFFTVGTGYFGYKGDLYNYNGTSKDIIFGKGDKNQPSLHTAFVQAGTGLYYIFSENINLKIASDFFIVRNGLLDMVHNFVEEERQQVFGVVPNITIGLSIRLGKISKGKSGGIRRQYLPFAP